MPYDPCIKGRLKVMPMQDWGVEVDVPLKSSNCDWRDVTWAIRLFRRAWSSVTVAAWEGGIYMKKSNVRQSIRDFVLRFVIGLLYQKQPDFEL